MSVQETTDGRKKIKEIMESKNFARPNLGIGNTSRKGFTLIELLVVIALVALLASIVSISLRHARTKAKVAKGLQWSQNIRSLLGPYCESWWTFDDGTASDASGNGNGGTIFGGAAFTDDTPNYMLGKALSFDGSDDYVIKNPFNIPSTEITVEFWMKSSDLHKDGTPVSYAVSSQSNEFLIYNYKNFGVAIKNSWAGTGVAANDGNWHHIAVTWKSLGGQIRFYKDGERVYSGTLAAGSQLTQGGALVIGQEQDSVGGGFDSNQAFLGVIDDVRIYNQAFSEQAIREYYLAGLKKHPKEVALAETQK